MLEKNLLTQLFSFPVINLVDRGDEPVSLGHFEQSLPNLQFIGVLELLCTDDRNSLGKFTHGTCNVTLPLWTYFLDLQVLFLHRLEGDEELEIVLPQFRCEGMRNSLQYSLLWVDFCIFLVRVKVHLRQALRCCPVFRRSQDRNAILWTIIIISEESAVR